MAHQLWFDIVSPACSEFGYRESADRYIYRGRDIATGKRVISNLTDRYADWPDCPCGCSAPYVSIVRDDS